MWCAPSQEPETAFPAVASGARNSCCHRLQAAGHIAEISEIRGVDSGGVIATLLDRKLITTAAEKP